MAVMTFAGCHYLIVSGPMARSETFRNDQIEGIPDRFLEVKPNIRTAPGFQKLIKPSASLAMIASEAVPRTASIRPRGTFAVSLDFEARHRVVLCKIHDALQCKCFKAFPELRMKSRLLAQRTQISFFGTVAFFCCSVRSAAGFGGIASNLGRITCRKCTLQFLIQLKVEFSLFPLCESFSCGHYELSIHFHPCGVAHCAEVWRYYSLQRKA